MIYACTFPNCWGRCTLRSSFTATCQTISTSEYCRTRITSIIVWDTLSLSALSQIVSKEPRCYFFSQIAEEPCCNTLRTKEQLGYIANSAVVVYVMAGTWRILLPCTLTNSIDQISTVYHDVEHIEPFTKKDIHEFPNQDIHPTSPVAQSCLYILLHGHLLELLEETELQLKKILTLQCWMKIKTD
ncbi:uncharacterized protein AFUA_6G00193 [Aspergillus fumigatus Af293]|uniref:Uncharacterized protein n=1 Tax=Aspergillus fumigatus (strain ATCC MYA-4609 / CBS 101355 / FGSC A1100 / Af293) TaxID=330879 RepID=Q4W8X2_ASPFU|nr:hypothetical protein AFUA_6G00193 [Aspergillus fumigatus Af293]EAL84247.1 hypothetical protein AFUA_6G00193 [Aspergillus fumigatus Af293]